MRARAVGSGPPGFTDSCKETQVLEECERALFVADREGARVHRFSLISRAIEGARLPC